MTIDKTIKIVFLLLFTPLLANENKQMELFVYNFCPYCIKVINAINQMGYKAGEIKVINALEQENQKRLLSLSGKKQTPFLIDGEIKMHESEEIIRYLRKKKG